MTHQTFPKPTREVEESRKRWCNRQPCILIGILSHECRGAVEASHVRLRGIGGMGTKPSDFRTLPKCHKGHLVYHALGRRVFEETFGLDLEKLIVEHNARYNREHPQRPRKVRVQRAVRLFAKCTCGESHRVKMPGLTFWCARVRRTFSFAAHSGLMV